MEWLLCKGTFGLLSILWSALKRQHHKKTWFKQETESYVGTDLTDWVQVVNSGCVKTSLWPIIVQSHSGRWQSHIWNYILNSEDGCFFHLATKSEIKPVNAFRCTEEWKFPRWKDEKWFTVLRNEFLYFVWVWTNRKYLVVIQSGKYHKKTLIQSRKYIRITKV